MIKGQGKVAIIIQARMSSNRFPGKMMTHLFDMPLIAYIYERCKRSSVEKVLVATSSDASDDILYNYCKKNNILAMRGSLDNVLERYIQAGDSLGVDYIVRVCGDTPFVDISLIDTLLEKLIREKLDYASFDREKCASGFYSEVVTLQALKRTAVLTSAKEDLEHVTKFIVNNRDKFSTRFMDTGLNPQFLKKLRITIDFPQDMQRANTIVNELGDKFSFTSEEILNIASKKGIQ